MLEQFSIEGSANMFINITDLVPLNFKGNGLWQFFSCWILALNHCSFFENLQIYVSNALSPAPLPCLVSSLTPDAGQLQYYGFSVSDAEPAVFWLQDYGWLSRHKVIALASLKLQDQGAEGYDNMPPSLRFLVSHSGWGSNTWTSTTVWLKKKMWKRCACINTSAHILKAIPFFFLNSRCEKWFVSFWDWDLEVVSFELFRTMNSHIGITEPLYISLTLLEVIMWVTIRTEGVVYHRFKNISLST